MMRSVVLGGLADQVGVPLVTHIIGVYGIVPCPFDSRIGE